MRPSSDAASGAATPPPLSSSASIYSCAGNAVTHYDLDPRTGELTRGETLTLGSVIQYGCLHPSNRHLYLSTSDGTRGSRQVDGSNHFLYALRRQESGRLEPHGQPARLRQRPVHNSVDRSGRYALVAYNTVSDISVHAITPDGSLGDELGQPDDLDTGIWAHQALASPSNRSVVLVTRGEGANQAHPKGEPGALKTFSFDDGRLANLSSFAAGETGGYGYSPRNLDFHPHKPWCYVVLEIQNQLHMHELRGDALDSAPSFIVPTTERPPLPGINQVAGTIHVHPQGHVLYVVNRVSAKTHDFGPFPFVDGENDITVFAIDPRTGEPKPIQRVDPVGFHIRSFTIDPSGQLLIAASLAEMVRTVDGQARHVSAGLSVFKIRNDGTLLFLTKTDVELGQGVQHMWVGAAAS
jgi:6-phosphogluconolactonase (cycloisomerase 2 family)